MKIVFMGTPDFARESLEKLYDVGHEIAFVVAPPDRPKGRGMKMIACEVKEFALEKGIEVLQPEKLSEIKERIVQASPEMIVVVSYGKFLPKSILKIPQFGCINVHPSLLPKYRGSAPIQWAILNGDKVTGTTIMKMNEKMDAGDIILQKEVPIDESETTGQLWERLAKISSELLLEAISQIEKGTANYQKQPEEYTIAPMLTKDMAKIDWENQDALTIKNLVRGLNPILGAYCNLGQKKIKFWRVDVAKEMPETNEEVGTVLLADSKKGLFVQTKSGVLSILEIQGENARKMAIQDFLRGNPIKIRRKICINLYFVLYLFLIM